MITKLSKTGRDVGSKEQRINCFAFESPAGGIIIKTFLKAYNLGKNKDEKKLKTMEKERTNEMEE